MMFVESSWGVKSVIPNDRHVSLVPELFGNVIPEQERSLGRKDNILSSSWLLPRIRRWKRLIICDTLLADLMSDIWTYRVASKSTHNLGHDFMHVCTCLLLLMQPKSTTIVSENGD